MSWSAKIRRTPLRLATGAFIVNSGIDHLKVDEETQGQLHEMAAGTYPFLRKVDPRLFAKALAVGELAVGGLLLAPIVPPGLAGLALTGFAGGLVGCTPERRGCAASVRCSRHSAASGTRRTPGSVR